MDAMLTCVGVFGCRVTAIGGVSAWEQREQQRRQRDDRAQHCAVWVECF